jgi:hypothetical protein
MSRFSDFADAVHVTLDDATVQKLVGDSHKGSNRQQRRVQWYRTGGEMTADTGQAGGRETTGSTVREPAVWTRLEDITCHIFAESEDTLDDLFDNVIVAIDNTARAFSVQLGEYSWEHPGKGEFATRNPMVELIMSLKLPVSDEQKTLVTITDEDLTCEIDEDL